MSAKFSRPQFSARASGLPGAETIDGQPPEPQMAETEFDQVGSAFWLGALRGTALSVLVWAVLIWLGVVVL